MRADPEPVAREGQQHGWSGSGIAQVLYEEVADPEGQPLTATLADYRMPPSAVRICSTSRPPRPRPTALNAPGAKESGVGHDRLDLCRVERRGRRAEPPRCEADRSAAVHPERVRGGRCRIAPVGCPTCGSEPPPAAFDDLPDPWGAGAE
ncbi:molybdopterin-dependent oxidoreductase [Pseudonocardia sp. MCCB 268]|nr:molybdopterin-dependent oxidoreductase [Pseudonocardia cytotoxica]